MDLFYVIVLSVAVLFLILLLTSFGVMLKKSKAVKAYPQNAPYCPDYWNVVPTVNSDGTIDYKCQVPDSLTSNMSSLKKYSKGKLSIPDTSVTSDANGTYINFYTDEMWKGNTGVCNKYNWATTNSTNSTINWDGITNVNNASIC